jgi:hypothetical protein
MTEAIVVLVIVVVAEAAVIMLLADLVNKAAISRQKAEDRLLAVFKPDALQHVESNERPTTGRVHYVDDERMAELDAQTD